MYELMHICVHVYKGERVGPYLSHSFVMVTLCNYYIVYYIKPLMGHIMKIYNFSPLTFVLFSSCFSLYLSPYRKPLGRGGESIIGFTAHSNNTFSTPGASVQAQRTSTVAYLVDALLPVRS